MLHENELHSVITEAIRQQQAGRLEEAQAAYQRILESNPLHADALHLMGMLRYQRSRVPTDGIDLVQRALRVKPDEATFHNSLGTLLASAGNRDQATEAFMRAVQLQPTFAQAVFNLASAYEASGRVGDAIEQYRRAIDLVPSYARAYYSLAIALYKHNEFDKAIEAFAKSGELLPTSPECPSNIGNVLKAMGRGAEAIEWYRKAIAIGPGFVDAHFGLGITLQEQGRWQEAIVAYESASRLSPERAEIRWNLALALLTTGDYPRGFREYEWRWRWPQFPSPRRNFTQPQWTGNQLQNGQTILLHAEQGIGDTIQFARYISLVQQLGVRVIVECQTELARLFRRVLTVEQVVARGQPLPPFDLHCPLMSLPLVFGTTIESIPVTVPYLAADSALANDWHARLPNDQQLKVGLVWAGGTKHREDQARSLTLEFFKPLWGVSNVRFISLQKGDPATQAGAFALPLLDETNLLADFEDTAALVSNLDLIISVDTAVAHLAGAMGKPVWVLLSHAHDWRWMLERTDSKWYPTARLFRRARSCGWTTVITEVAEALAGLC